MTNNTPTEGPLPLSADPYSCAAVAGRLLTCAEQLRDDVAATAATERLADDTESLALALGHFAEKVRTVAAELDAADRTVLDDEDVARMHHRHATELGKARSRLLDLAVTLASSGP